MTRGTIHLVCGATGAGKTTYAKKLCESRGAVRFSIDEWMSDLFWMDTPQPLDPSWSLERVARCSRRIWETARAVASRGLPCVLDLGFSTRAHRAEIRERAEREAFETWLHFLDVPAEVRWRRVQARNSEGAGELPFEVTREMFDFVERMFEAPGSLELEGVRAVRVKE